MLTGKGAMRAEKGVIRLERGSNIYPMTQDFSSAPFFKQYQRLLCISATNVG